MMDDSSMMEATHVETTKSEHFAILGGGVRVPLEDVLRVSAAGFNAANAKAKFANPAPLGYCMWFLGTFVSGLYLCKVPGVPLIDMIAVFGVLVTGVGSFIVGNLEVLCENAFGASAMTIFAMFWMSWGASFIETFGISAAYADAPEQLMDIKALFFMIWFFVFFLLTWCTIRSTVVFFVMFLTFTFGLFMQMLQNFLRSDGCETAAGVLFVISGFMALASAYGGLATPETAYIFGKTIYMPGNIAYQKQHGSH